MKKMPTMKKMAAAVRMSPIFFSTGSFTFFFHFVFHFSFHESLKKSNWKQCIWSLEVQWIWKCWPSVKRLTQDWDSFAEDGPWSLCCTGWSQLSSSSANNVSYLSVDIRYKPLFEYNHGYCKVEVWQWSSSELMWIRCPLHNSTYPVTYTMGTKYHNDLLRQRLGALICTATCSRMTWHNQQIIPALSWLDLARQIVTLWLLTHLYHFH